MKEKQPCIRISQINRYRLPNLLKRENALLMRQSPRWLQGFAALLLFIGTGMLITAYVVRIDEVVTATGQLKAADGREEVKAPVGGQVAAVVVSNGESVQTGDRLLSLDTTLAKEQKERAEKLIALERNSLQRQLSSLSLQKQTYQQRLNTQELVTSEYKQLVESGGIARIQYLQARDQSLALTNQLNEIDERRRALEIESEKRVRELQSQLQTAEQQLRYQNIVATSSGIVFDLKVREAGVVQTGETILSIIPTDGLKAEVFIPNKDIGFVKVGQEAKVRVDAFPSSRYGELTGSVDFIGADALPPEAIANYYRFPVNIQLQQSWLETNGVRIPLRSGMSITSNLRIREKRAISLISDFFTGQMDSIKALRN